MTNKKIAIIGGGIVGSTAAYYCTKAGHTVHLYDEGTGQATKAAAGIICPWFTLRRNKAWYYLVSNGAEFYRQFMQDLAKDGVPTEEIFQEVGTLLIRKNEASLQRDLEKAEEKKEASPSIQFVKTIRKEQLKEYFPELESEHDASFVKGGARLNGTMLIEHLHHIIQQLGATVYPTKATLTADKKVNNQHYDAILLAAGAWLPDLLEPLGYEVKVRPQKGQLFSIYDEKWRNNQWPVVMPPGKFDIIPFSNGEIVIGATHEDDRDYDLSIEMSRLQELAEKAQTLIPSLENTTYHQVKVGIRAYTPDFGVLVGEVPALQNVWAISGLGSSGLTSGPFLGYQWSQFIKNQTWNIPLENYPISQYIKKM